MRRGEILGIRLVFINNLPEDAMGLVVLEDSEEYRFVETGPDGEVEHYAPSLVAGERHHMITVRILLEIKSLLQSKWRVK